MTDIFCSKYQYDVSILFIPIWSQKCFLDRNKKNKSVLQVWAPIIQENSIVVENTFS